MPRKNAKAASSESDGKEFFAAIAQIEKEKGIPFKKRGYENTGNL